MRNTLRLILILILGSWLSQAASGLRFIEEDLSFELCDSVFSVSGIYYFMSAEEKEYPILYPFPEDSAYSRPYDISVLNMRTGKEMGYSFQAISGHLFFTLRVSGETPVRIDYKQRLYAKHARYILLSTRSWGQPLKIADLSLKIPPDITITDFSLPPDKEIMLEGQRLYLWQKRNFIPDCDFIIRF
ncbi:MAG: hypothetical protein JXR21_03045 [Candidatus Marinimicrobia bacterium]|nr:hypothetical protein [Candidatus Neomarinimicrobiota bacterium]